MKLSVIIPLYNVEAYVAQCFEALYDQGLEESDFEIIVVNDGSTDNSLSIVEQFAGQHVNIRIFSQENQGVAHARNVAMSKATGEYIYFADPDDYLLPNKLSLLISEADTTGADIVRADYCNMIEKTGEITQSLQKVNKSGRVVSTGKEFLLRHFDAEECFLWINLFRRSLLVNNSITFPIIRSCSDAPYSFQAFYLAGKVVFLPEVICHYRRYSDSITGQTTNAMWVVSSYRLSKLLSEIYQRYSVPVEYCSLFNCFSFIQAVRVEIWNFAHTDDPNYKLQMRKEYLYLSDVAKSEFDMKDYLLIKVLYPIVCFYVSLRRIFK